MKKIERSVLVPLSAEFMYRIVNDIEAYPEFLPGCVGARIMASDEDWMEAELVLAKAGLKQAFTTRNDLVPNESITLHLKKGPFKRFEGQWRFEALGQSGEACKVSFSLSFEFSNPLLSLAASKLLEAVASEQVDAMSKRARYLHSLNNS